MKGLITISQGMIPMIILGIICCGACQKVDMYQTFIDGAKQGLRTVVGILPTLIGLMTAVGILRASGFMEVLGKMLGTVTERFGFPGELMPLTIVKMFSSSAATGLLLDIYKELLKIFFSYCTSYYTLYNKLHLFLLKTSIKQLVTHDQ